MPRDGSGIASFAPGTEGAPSTVISSAKYNAMLADLLSMLNSAYPVAFGGTGGTTISTARDSLEVDNKVLSKSANYSAVAGDRSKLIVGTASLTLSFPPAATLGDGWIIAILSNTGTMTVDPDGSELINGQSTLQFIAGNNAVIYCDGTTFHSVDTLHTVDLTTDVSGVLPSANMAGATLTAAGVVEHSTSAENITGTDDTVWPSVAGVKEMIDTHGVSTAQIATEFILTKHGTYSVDGPVSSAAWLFLGTALTAGTSQFYAQRNLKLYSARWLVAWNPNAPTANNTAVRLIHADSGPTNVVAFTGSQFLRNSTTTPVTDALDITAQMKALITAGAQKTLGHQSYGDGTNAAKIYSSVIECIWDVV